jgi:hypothetical protein
MLVRCKIGTQESSVGPTMPVGMAILKQQLGRNAGDCCAEIHRITVFHGYLGCLWQTVQDIRITLQSSWDLQLSCIRRTTESKDR